MLCSELFWRSIKFLTVCVVNLIQIFAVYFVAYWNMETSLWQLGPTKQIWLLGPTKQNLTVWPHKPESDSWDPLIRTSWAPPTRTCQTWPTYQNLIAWPTGRNWQLGPTYRNLTARAHWQKLTIGLGPYCKTKMEIFGSAIGVEPTVMMANHLQVLQKMMA